MKRWIYPMNPQDDSAGDQVGEPPDDLIREWYHKAQKVPPGPLPFCQAIAALAAQWGWDQREPEIQKARDEEREAIIHWLLTGPYGASISVNANSLVGDLRASRLPKPPNLKELALNDLDNIQTHDQGGREIVNLSNIRLALESLPQ